MTATLTFALAGHGLAPVGGFHPERGGGAPEGIAAPALAGAQAPAIDPRRGRPVR